MRPLRLQFWIAALAILAVGSVCASAQTQPDEISLGTSTTELQLSGGGSGSSTITVSIDSAAPATFVDGAGLSVTCSAGAGGGFLFGCGSASGSGTLASSTTSTVAAYFVFWSTSQTPITLLAQGAESFSVEQSAPIYFNFSSAQGTLTGSLMFDSVLSGVGNSAQAMGMLTNLGGSFAGAFPGGQAEVTFQMALGASLQSLVGTSSTITGQVEFPGTIAPSQGNATCDFLTGGGWIPNNGASGPGANPGAGNGKATFAIEGGCKHGHGWGHLNYIDHGSGMHVIGRAAPDCDTAYQVVSNGPPNANGQPTGCRRMQGNAEVNGQPGFTYTVEACDYGEPGTSDTFSVILSNGYTNSATLGGGNIQLHKGNRSFCGGGNGNSGNGNQPCKP